MKSCCKKYWPFLISRTLVRRNAGSSKAVSVYMELYTAVFFGKYKFSKDS